jgi:hypothetical protein
MILDGISIGDDGAVSVYTQSSMARRDQSSRHILDVMLQHLAGITAHVQ